MKLVALDVKFLSYYLFLHSEEVSFSCNGRRYTIAEHKGWKVLEIDLIY